MKTITASGSARVAAIWIALFCAIVPASSNAGTSGPKISLTHSGDQVPEANGVPQPDHVVIVIEENHSYSEIIGSPNAPYINSLAAQGAVFTQSYAVTHPSQPNYLDLFSGFNQGVTDDS